MPTSRVPRVFISATSRDLGSYRRAVAEVLLKLEVMPIVQDHFAPDYRSVVEMLRAKVGECDAVICLVGPYYGREPRDRAADQPRRSYTQLEYEMAVELRKPVFVFTAAPDCPLDSPDDEPEELRGLQLEHIRRIAAVDRIRMSFRSPAHLTDQVRVMRFDPRSLEGVTRQLVVLMRAELIDGGDEAGGQRPDEVTWVREVVQPFQARLQELLRRRGGTLQSETACAYEVNFATADAAVSAALELHQAPPGPGGGPAPGVRAGIHVGQIVRFGGADDDREVQVGRAMELCRKLTAMAAPGQTLLTRVAFDVARESIRPAPSEGPGGSATLCWKSYGRYLLAGSEESQEICEVGVAGRAPLAAPPDSPAARRADSLEESQMQGWRPGLGQEVPRRPGWIIRDKLGEGGFGEVWVAQHDRTKELRVFKFCFDPTRLTSFKRELTLFRLLRGALGRREDIARLLEVELDEAPYYLESEYVEGGNLYDWGMTKGHLAALPLGERLRLMAEIAIAVAAAHSVGIIHKDLKPSNVFMRRGPDGRWHPMLADFGIGAVADRSVLEQRGITVAGFTRSLLEPGSSRTGTRMYQPPEANLARPATVQGDVYALGVLLYQAVVGDLDQPLGHGWERRLATAPGEGANAGESAGASPGAAGPPGERDDLLVQLLQEDIGDCVAGDPGLRLAGAAELAERLQAMDGRVADVLARRRHERTRLRMRRLRMALAASVTALVIVGGLGVFALTEWYRAERQKRRADQALAAAEANATRAARNERAALESEKTARDNALLAREGERHATQSLYVARMRLAMQSWNEGNVLKAAQILESQVPRPAPGRQAEDLRGLEWYCLHGLKASVWHFVGTHGGAVQDLAITADGRVLASAGRDRTIGIWDVEGRRPRHTLRGHTDWANSVAFAPDGRLLASASDDQTVRLWDAESGALLRTLKGHTGWVRVVAFSRDGRTLASASRDGTVRLWDAASGAAIRTIKGNSDQPLALAFGPDGRRLTLATDKGLVRWDANDPDNVRVSEFNLEAGSQVVRLAISDDARWLAIQAKNPRAGTGAPGQVELRDIESTGWRIGLEGPPEEVTVLAFGPGRMRLFASGASGRIWAWDTTTGRVVFRTRVANSVTQDLAVSSDGRRLVVVGPSVGTPVGTPILSLDLPLLGEDARPGDRRISIREAGPNPSAGEASRVTFSPDGRWLAAGVGREIRLRDAATGMERRTLAGVIEGAIYDVAFSPDGRWVAAGSQGRNVALWEFAGGRQVGPLTGHGGSVFGVAFDPRGRWLATASADRTIRLWGVEGNAVGRPVRTLAGYDGSVSGLAFSPDGSRIASAASDRTVKVWDPETGRVIRTLTGHAGPVVDVAFGPDGRTLASIAGAETRLWDLADGKEIWTATGHMGTINGLAFSPDGHTIVTCSNDSRIKFWNVATGDDVLTLPCPRAVPSVAVSPDGWRLAAVCSDDDIRSWDLALLAADRPLQGWAALADRGYLRAYAGDEKGALDDLTEAIRRGAEGWAPSYCRARLYLRRGRYREALEDLDRVVARNPEGAAARLQRSLALGRLGRMAEAQGEYLRARELTGLKDRPELDPLSSRDLEPHRDPIWSDTIGDYTTAVEGGFDAGWVRRGRGLALAFTGYPEEAAREFTRALEADPTDFEARLGRLLAWRYTSRIRYFWRPAKGLLADDRQELDDWTELIRREPGDWKWHFFRGRLHNAVEQYSPAVADFARAIELGGRSHRVFRELAQVHERLKDDTAAIRAYSDALKLNPPERDVESLLAACAGCYEKQGRWTEAIACYTETIRKSPSSSQYWKARGKAKAHLGRFQEAIADYDEYAKAARSNQTWWRRDVSPLRYLADARLGRWDELEKDCADAAAESGAIELGPGETWSDRRRGNSRMLTAWAELAADCTAAIEAGAADRWAWRGRAMAHASAREWDRAEADFTRALEENPDDWWSWVGRGRVRAELRQWIGAAEDFERAARLRPREGLPCYLLGVVLVQQWKYEPAADALTRAIEERGFDGPGVREQRAWALRRLGRWDAAVADYMRATAAKKDDWDLWFNQGFAHAMTGQWEDAIRCCEASIAAKKDKRESSDARTWLLKGRAQAALGRDSSALSSFSESIRLNRRSVPLWLGRQMANARLGNLDDARASYASARTYCYGVTYDVYLRWDERDRRWPEGSDEDIQAVEADYTRAIDAGRAGAWAWRGRGLARIARGRWASAGADFTEAIKADPNDFDAWHDRARVNAELGRWDRAQADWERALHLRPRDWSTLCFLGMVHARQGRYREAVESYTRGIEHGANGWAPLEARALAFQALGQRDRADADLSQTILIGGGGWRVHHHRGLLHAREGRWDEAADDFAAAIDLTADSPEVWHHLALARLARGRDDDYRATCRQLLDRFGRDPDRRTLRSMLATCVLAGDALDDPGRLLALADRAFAPGDPGPDAPSLRGAALYRGGRFDEAIASLEQAVGAGSGAPGAKVRDRLLLAMAHRRIGHDSQAREWCEAAGTFGLIVDEWTEQATRDGPMASLETRLLRDEAERLIKARGRGPDGPLSRRDAGPR